MLTDAQLMLDEESAHLTTEATTNYIDLSAARDIGAGRNLYVFAAVTTAMTDGASNSTMTLTLESDDNTSFSSATTIQTIGVFSALSAVGTTLVARLQPITTPERYLRGKWTVANGDLSTGNFTVTITDDVDKWRAYANGYTIS
jgi:hypothetical protein